MIDINLSDEWGGIDKKIKSSVLGLNLHGIVTTGSCEGDKAPCPWIMVKSSSKRTKNKFNKLLKEFYKARKISRDVKIKTFAIGARFYIFSGKRETFRKWRKSANDAAKNIAKGKEPKPEKNKISPQKYQKEFIEFGTFLLESKG